LAEARRNTAVAQNMLAPIEAKLVRVPGRGHPAGSSAVGQLVAKDVTLRAKLKPLAPGLTPRAVLDKLAAIQMLDVHFPTTDGRTLILSRYTELNVDQKLLVKRLKLDLPSQPPPRITAPVGQRARVATQHV
jgi:hypothetical protein